MNEPNPLLDTLRSHVRDLDVLRAFVASTGQVPGDARVVVRTSDDQRDGASFTLKVTFEGAPS